MASLWYLKHAYKLRDEEPVERWAENVVWQHFSGMTFYKSRLPCDATQIGRFRSNIRPIEMRDVGTVHAGCRVACLFSKSKHRCIFFFQLGSS